MPYPRVIPHSDGSGTVDAVSEGASREWVGRRVWCYGAQSYRPFGTAAEYTVVPLKQVVQLPQSTPLELPVSAFPALPLTGQFMSQVQSKGERFWLPKTRSVLKMQEFRPPQVAAPWDTRQSFR